MNYLLKINAFKMDFYHRNIGRSIARKCLDLRTTNKSGPVWFLLYGHISRLPLPAKIYTTVLLRDPPRES